MLQQTIQTLHLGTSTDQIHKSPHLRVSAIIPSANSSNRHVTSVTDKRQGPCFPAEVTVAIQNGDKATGESQSLIKQVPPLLLLLLSNYKLLEAGTGP